MCVCIKHYVYIIMLYYNYVLMIIDFIIDIE